MQIGWIDFTQKDREDMQSLFLKKALSGTKNQKIGFCPKKNRIDYGQILLPPEGYQLEKAVGTTYSLDFEALILILACLGLHKKPDRLMLHNPEMILQAIQKTKDRVVVFCEAGRIRPSKIKSPLPILLEKIIVPVALEKTEKQKRYPIFHPKTWTIQYRNKKGKRKYRFIVLSKNLTFDQNWEICLIFDGEETRTGIGKYHREKIRKQEEKTKPIIDFLAYLASTIEGDSLWEKQKDGLLANLMCELAHVSFVPSPKEAIDDFWILPMGIGKKGYAMGKDSLFQKGQKKQENQCQSQKTEALVVVSPFLNGSVLERFHSENRKNTGCRKVLITRKEELAQVRKDQVDQFEIYILKPDLLRQYKKEMGAEAARKRKQELHAKILFDEGTSEGKIYLGSMNTTKYSINQNVEMMVCLRVKKSRFNVNDFLEELDIENKRSGNLFFEKIEKQKVFREDQKSFSGGEQKDVVTEEFQQAVPAWRESNVKLQEHTSEKVLKRIFRLDRRALVEKNGNFYRVTLLFPGEKEDKHIRISPMGTGKKAFFGSKIQFDNLDIFQLSQFYRIKIKTEKESFDRVIMIPTEGLPKEREYEAEKRFLHTAKEEPAR